MILNENVNIAELDFHLRHLNELLVAAGIAPHVMFSGLVLLLFVWHLAGVYH